MGKVKDNTTSTQVADKIINIENIETANIIGFKPGDKPFNLNLTKRLMDSTQKFDEGIQNFLNEIPDNLKDSWNSEKVFLNKAKGLLEGAYVWIIGWQLRRLFAIGNRPQSQELVTDYFSQIFQTYRLSLQLVNYALITTLWDHSKQNDIALSGELKGIASLFKSTISIRSDEYLSIFLELMEVFEKMKVELPFSELSRDTFIDKEGAFRKACGGLISLKKEMSSSNVNPDQCYKAEEHLAEFLSAFSFLANYQLVSMKKIEYEWQRNREPRYIRDFNILGKDRNPKKLLKYGSVPFNSYAVFLRSSEVKIDLFPFVLDLNALTVEDGSRICFFEHRIADSGLNYYVIDDEAEHKIEFRGVRKNNEDDLELKQEQQLDLRLDTVILQFLDALNSILGSKEKFKPISEQKSKFDNL